jgi:hypothetical protein
LNKFFLHFLYNLVSVPGKVLKILKKTLNSSELEVSTILTLKATESMTNDLVSKFKLKIFLKTFLFDGWH